MHSDDEIHDQGPLPETVRRLLRRAAVALDPDLNLPPEPTAEDAADAHDLA